MRKYFRKIAFVLVLVLVVGNIVPIHCVGQVVQVDDEVVNVIITLKDKALLDLYRKEEQSDYLSVTQYLESDEGKDEREGILDEQERLSKKLDNIKILYQYTTIINGIAAQVNKADIQNIKALKEVQDVTIAREYESTEATLDNEISIEGSSERILSTYTGKGTVVSVIDTGADITHDVFSKDVAQPKLSKSNITQVVNEKHLHVAASAGDVYKSVKIPFAYDYADKDTNVCPNIDSIIAGNSHGTHVASVAAANQEENMSGVAKNAQILVMKVFDEKRVANTTNVIAAMEDSLLLGADVINLSLGSPVGFSSPDTIVEEQVYDKIASAGINVVSSAGNNYDSSNYNAVYGYTLSTNPDNGTINSPASYSACNAVASVKGSSFTSPYFTVNGKKIDYNEWAQYGQPKLSTFKGEKIEYYVINGSGTDADYEGIDVAGKIVVVSLSALPYIEVVKVAQSKGAIGVIIYNVITYPLEIDLSEKVDIPVVSVSMSNGSYLLSQANKIIEVTDEVASFDRVGGTVSEFSSWGANTDLEIKPEIAAPGEEIYGALPNGNYGNMTGTSMATPIISGYILLLKEYINSVEELAKLSDREKSELVMQLLMSTAVPQVDTTGAYFSPRRQGSGLADVKNALSTKAFLYTDNTIDTLKRPKLNLYDDPDRTGVFKSKFHIKNISKEQIRYAISYEALREGVSNIADGVWLVGKQDLSVKSMVDCSIKVDGEAISNQEITIDAGSDREIEVTISLNDKLKTATDKNMKNGAYIEGYIQFVPAEGECKLSIPYMGYYGSWTEPPIFDTGDIYGLGGYSQGYNALFTDKGKHILGINPFDSYMYYFLQNSVNPLFDLAMYEAYTLKPDRNKIAISPNKDGLFDSIDVAVFSLLRNVKSLVYELQDSQGKVVWRNEECNVSKSVLSKKTGRIATQKISFDLSSYFNSTNVKNDEVYTLYIKGKLDYDKAGSDEYQDQISYPLTVDKDKPVVTNVENYKENDKNYLKLDVSDNQYVANIELDKKDTEGKKVKISSKNLNEEEKGATTSVMFDITSALTSEEDINTWELTVYDYAMNKTTVSVGQALNPVVSPTTETSTIQPPTIAPSVETPSGGGETVNQTRVPTSGDVIPTSSAKPGTTEVKPTPSLKPETSKAPSISIDNSKKLKVSGLRIKKKTKKTKKTVTVTWNKVINATHYEIYVYDKSLKKYIKVAAVSDKQNSYTIRKIGKKPLKAGVKYKVKVRAVRKMPNKITYGGFSNILTVNLKK